MTQAGNVTAVELTTREELETKQKRKSKKTILLVGNTNVGKSTLFNALTGAHQQMVNAPGTTVDVMAGDWQGTNWRILDLPGTYSLIPASPDEEVVTDTIAGKAGSLTDAAHGNGIDLVLAVLDSTSLTRSLYLVAQIAQTGLPVAALMSLADVAQKNGTEVDPTRLSQELGVPVMAIDPRRAKQNKLLREFVDSALKLQSHVRGIEPDPSAPGFNAAAAQRAVNTPGCCQPGASIDERNLLQQTLCSCGKEFAPGEDCCQEAPVGKSCGCGHAAPSTLRLDRDFVAVDGEADAQLQRAKVLFAWVDRVETSLGREVSDPHKRTLTDRVDQVLLNPFFGPIIFFALMWFLFKLAGEWLGPVQDLFDSFFTNTESGAISLANGFTWLLGLVGWQGGALEQFLVGGIAAGLGVVASFVPLMFTIFVAISMLEDSGYLARAAFLADRLMRKIGLDGRVVLPLVMGFGCNLPALAAARALPSASQRLVTAIITPLTSCAARLTIYLMMAKIFFPDNAGTVIFVMYVISVVLVVFAAWLMKFFVTKDEAKSPLFLVLPAYQTPRVVVLLRTAAQRSWAFVKGAGKIIVVMTIGVWLLGAIPMGANAQGSHFADPELHMEDSAYGQVAKVLEPVFEPAGFGEWHLTGALMTGFVAKETMVSSIVVSYNMDAEAAGDAEDNGNNLGVLPDLLNETFTQTAGAGLQGLAAMAFMIFVLAYTPCLATVGEQVRLIGGKLTAVAVAVQLLGAWLLAVGVFQIGKLILG